MVTWASHKRAVAYQVLKTTLKSQGKPIASKGQISKDFKSIQVSHPVLTQAEILSFSFMNMKVPPTTPHLQANS